MHHSQNKTTNSQTKFHDPVLNTGNDQSCTVGSLRS